VVDGWTADDPLRSLMGTYYVKFAGKAGGPHEPSNSIVSGTTTGIKPFSKNGTVTISVSQPGVIAVPDGGQVPGVAKQDIIFGAAVIQNPLRISIGTPEASEFGDFGIYTMMKFGLPADPGQLFYSGCTGAGGPFSCVPMFYRRSAPSGRSVNLIYHTVRVEGSGNSVVISGRLLDTHISEASVVNIFNVPISSPIMGPMNDPFMFDAQTRFEMRISGGNITGSIKGTGHSIAGLAPQTAIFELTFSGKKQ
jgi:hypothetical protein